MMVIVFLLKERWRVKDLKIKLYNEIYDAMTIKVDMVSIANLVDKIVDKFIEPAPEEQQLKPLSVEAVAKEIGTDFPDLKHDRYAIAETVCDTFGQPAPEEPNETRLKQISNRFDDRLAKMSDEEIVLRMRKLEPGISKLVREEPAPEEPTPPRVLGCSVGEYRMRDSIAKIIYQADCEKDGYDAPAQKIIDRFGLVLDCGIKMTEGAFLMNADGEKIRLNVGDRLWIERAEKEGGE